MTDSQNPREDQLHDKSYDDEESAEHNSEDVKNEDTPPDAMNQQDEVKASKPKNKESKKSFFKKFCKDCEKHEQEAEQYKAGWQRALADYKNLQRETSERRSEWAQMSEQQIVEDFIPIYDNFSKAFSVEIPAGENHKAWENWRMGIGYIMKQFGEVLKNHNVEQIKTVGEKFDTNFHEAVGEEVVEGIERDMIVKEILPGYKMGNRVIRVAKVIVAK